MIKFGVCEAAEDYQSTTAQTEVEVMKRVMMMFVRRFVRWHSHI
jgi:hypothetical protein